MKKLLILSNNPDRASFVFRIQAYLGRLQRQGIDCHIERIPPGLSSRRRLYRSAGQYDGVLLHKKKLNWHDALVLRRAARCLIYDVDDAVMYSTKHPHRFSYAHFVPFQRSARAADLVLAGNAYLAEHARHVNPNVMILPTGLDTQAYQVPVAHESGDPVRLVWIGSRSTLEYIRDLAPVLDCVAESCPWAVLRLICDDFFKLHAMPVEEMKWSQDTQVHHLTTSDIGLAPLPDNRFTQGKCGFKILQYLAAGLPVIASPVGVNAELVEEGVNGFLAQDEGQWQERLIQLIRDVDLRRSMGQQGQRKVQAYDMDAIGQRFCDAIVNLLF